MRAVSGMKLAIPVAVEVEPRLHLAHRLREGRRRLGLTGTHLAAEHGACGAWALSG